MQGSPQQSPQLHVFLNQKQPMRRNNITVVEMNKSKIKFLNKYLSKSQMGTYSNAAATQFSSVSTGQSSQSAVNDEYNLQFRMKEKFEELYKRIQRISRNLSPDQMKGKFEKRFLVGPNQQIGQKKGDSRHIGLQQELIRMGYRSRPNNQRKQRQEQQPEAVHLQINTAFTREQQVANIKVIGGNTRYRHRLISIAKPAKMSNNIKDYLSVQKIRLKDLQDSIVQKQHNITTKNNKMRASLYSDYSQNLINHHAMPTVLPSLLQQKQKDKQIQNKMNATSSKYLSILKHKKFQVPFQTYFYRDLIWRVAYSNQKILEFPMQYESKIRVFVGRGNNSRLIKSIINRRAWYQVTEKIQQAHFIWTQIKVQSIFSNQIKVKTGRQSGKLKKSQNKPTYIEKSIWTDLQQRVFKKYFDSYKHSQSRMGQNMKFRNKTIIKPWLKITENHEQTDLAYTRSSAQLSSCSMPIIGMNTTTTTIPAASTHNVPRIKIHNHFINSYLIGNKKALFQTMSDYYSKKGDDVFNYLPLTFHISNGLEDQKYLKFLNYYYAIAKKGANQDDKNSKFNAWIVKPGQNTNRGNGINVCLTLQSIKNILKKKDKHNDGSSKTYIVQKYIQRPMLYKKRKFDLRHYIMINCSNGCMKGYWFKQGYVRTTSSQYTLKQGHGSVHLTNDAVQKNLPDYGKYEKGNKISYDQLEAYLFKTNSKWGFWEQAYPQMKKIATDVICASASSLDPDRRTNFEIYGLDFMIDEQMGVWLIQVNTNPCLELSCPLLAKIIPKMIQNTLEICLDPHYPPPLNFNPKGTTFKKNCLEQIEYELVYDDRFQENNESNSQLLNDQTLKKEEDDCYEDDGEDWNED